MADKVRVSAVSFLNTIPFVYGLKHADYLNDMDLSLDYPSRCAEKLINNQADIGLIPVAVIPLLQHPEIISDFCIGAVSKVRTVVLASQVSLNKIQKIYLDYQSRTSVRLVRILAQNYWKIQVEWQNTQAGFDFMKGNGTDGILVIGDKSFHASEHYKYVYDLAEEWAKYTELPFVFACWVANKTIPPSFLTEFSRALDYGISHIQEAVEEDKGELSKEELNYYLTKNISFRLDEQKRKGMKKFLEMIQE
jgi:chorismate dehydratase